MGSEPGNWKKFLLNWFGLAEARAARFSPAADMIPFDGLIHLTAD
jgi:hypothetical protein